MHMKIISKYILLFTLLFTGITYSKAQKAQLKPRIVVLTDIAPANVEPDDMESMVRLLAHADLFEIEALIATSGWNNTNKLYPSNWIDSLHKVITAYEKDLPLLAQRSEQKKLKKVKNKKLDIGLVLNI